MSSTVTLPRVRIIDPPVPLPEGVALPSLAVRPNGHVFREVRIPLWADNMFRRLWQSHKLAFRQRGFSVRQHGGAWWFQQWLAGAPGAWTLTPQGAEHLAALQVARPAVKEEPQEIPADLVLPELPFGLEAKLSNISGDRPGRFTGL